MGKITLRMVVACHSASGDPDLYFCKDTGHSEQLDNGDFYEVAKLAAGEEGYEGPMVAFDENDFAGMALMPLFVWDSASHSDISGD